MTWLRWYWWNWTLRSSATVFLLSTKLLIQSFWCSACNVWTPKTSLLINLWRKMSFDLVVFVSLYIIMNFACLLKTSSLSWQYLHANMASDVLTFLRWLFSLILKLVSDSPTYCFLHKVNSIRYILRIVFYIRYIPLGKYHMQ